MIGSVLSKKISKRHEIGVMLAISSDAMSTKNYKVRFVNISSGQAQGKIIWIIGRGLQVKILHIATNNVLDGFREAC